MVSVMEVYQLLPKTNCKKCGYPSCMAFAVALLGREAKIEDCTPLVEESKYEKKLENWLATSPIIFTREGVEIVLEASSIYVRRG